MKRSVAAGTVSARRFCDSHVWRFLQKSWQPCGQAPHSARSLADSDSGSSAVRRRYTTHRRNEHAGRQRGWRSDLSGHEGEARSKGSVEKLVHRERTGLPRRSYTGKTARMKLALLSLPPCLNSGDSPSLLPTGLPARTEWL